MGVESQNTAQRPSSLVRTLNSQPSTLNSLPGQSGATTGQPSTGFDRVLVDAPCSNTGVMRRRLDLRWRIQPAEIRRLHDLQLSLLKRAALQVKSGGVLVYSTCSLEPEENRGVVETFLKSNPGFSLDRCVETFPPRDGVDGSFAAKLIRNAS